MNNPTISIIAAIGKNRELGKDNKLLWSLPRDLKRFKEKTLNHPVIMGRKTFESIGRVLPQRTNIIVTKNPNYTVLGGHVFPSIEKAIEFAKTKDKEEIFIIGGAQIYSQSIEIANKIYLTIIDKSYAQADAFFPNYSRFKKVLKEEQFKDKQFDYKFVDLAIE